MLHLRLVVNLFVFIRRAIAWQEAVPIPLAFGVYTIGYALMAAPRPAPFDAWDILGCALFLVGTAFHTSAELGRHLWKAHPEYRGHLYAQGAFHYIRHPNYTGDVLWVGGIAVITHNPWAVIVPVVLLLFFAFGNGPMLDAYLAQRYSEEYVAWRHRSWSLIPFVF